MKQHLDENIVLTERLWTALIHSSEIYCHFLHQSERAMHLPMIYSSSLMHINELIKIKIYTRAKLTHENIICYSLKRPDLLKPALGQRLVPKVLVIPHHLQAENAVRKHLPVELHYDLVACSHGDTLHSLDFGVGQRRVEETSRMLFQVAEGNGDEADVGVEFLAVGAFDADRPCAAGFRSS